LVWKCVYRFGGRLEWTQFHTPQYLGRFLLLVGIALVLWTAVGHAAVERAPSVRRFYSLAA
jgi:hypothetical protein